MTGRDILIYILKHGLEDEEVYEDGRLLGFITVMEAAVKCNVGIATIHAWIQEKKIDFIQIGNIIFIPADFKSPIEKLNTN